MIYRRFGRTEIKMPVFSCGGMRYQYRWQDRPFSLIPKESQKNLESIVERALSHGINHFETARGYGTSERQLGKILPRLQRESIIVQTKVGPKKDSSEFVSEFEDSLKRLNLNYVDLFAIHGVNNEERLEWTLSENGCLEAARKLQLEGKARFIGFSTHAPTRLIVEAINTDRNDGFDYINLHWYYIFQNNWPAILEAKKKDMGVFIISPSDKGGKLYLPPKKLIELCKPLHPMAFNDLFCLSHPEIHTLSIGASKPKDFDLHVRSLKLLPEAGNILPPIIERLENTKYQAVGKKFALEYAERLPQWHDTPGNINIPFIVWLYVLAKSYDMIDYARMRYKQLGKDPLWNPGNNAEKTDELDIESFLLGYTGDKDFARKIHDILITAHREFG